MDEAMTEGMIGDMLLGRRLEAYAEQRLSPDLTTSSRLRARVLAVAHRHAAFDAAGPSLTVLSRADGEPGAMPVGGGTASAPATDRARSRPRNWNRAAAVVLAASLAGLVAGGVSAARPGGALYEARMAVETIMLPLDPSARALAELDRLRDRLREISEATAAGDVAGATAALAAYEAILDEASASTILAGDDVAAAVLETGVGRNVEVLQALAARLPANASAAVSRAVDAAIARSTEAIDRIDASRPARGDDNGPAGGPPVAEPTPRATKTPADKPTPKPDDGATAKPKPTPKATPEPTDAPEPTAAPERTPKPRNDQGVGPKTGSMPGSSEHSGTGPNGGGDPEG